MTEENYDRGKLLLTEAIMQRHGRRCKASGMAAPRTTVEVDAVS